MSQLGHNVMSEPFSSVGNTSFTRGTQDNKSLYKRPTVKLLKRKNKQGAVQVTKLRWKLHQDLPLYRLIWMLHNITESLENKRKPKHTSMIRSPSSFTRVASLCIITQHAVHQILWEKPSLIEVSGKFEIFFSGARMKVREQSHRFQQDY